MNETKYVDLVGVLKMVLIQGSEAAFQTPAKQRKEMVGIQKSGM